MLSIETKITSEDNSCTISHINEINNLKPLTNDFQVANVYQQKIKIPADGTFNPIALQDLFNIAQDKYSFIHIELHDTDYINTINDARFDLEFDGVMIGSFSEFLLTNINGLLIEINISNVTVTKEAYLTLMVGEK